MTEEYNIKDFEKTVINEIGNMKGTLHNIVVKVEMLLERTKPEIRPGIPGIEMPEPTTNNTAQVPLLKFRDPERTKEKPFTRFEYSLCLNVTKMLLKLKKDPSAKKPSERQMELYKKFMGIWAQYREDEFPGYEIKEEVYMKYTGEKAQ